MSEGLYVNYGCGASVAEGWLNFDCSPTLRLERLPLAGSWLKARGRVFPEGVLYGDIVKGLPLAPGSCKGIYASHVHEHLSLADCRTALVKTRALLAEGGRFRIVVPDLAQAARVYVKALKGAEAAHAADRFLRDTLLGEEERPRDPRALLRAWLGSTRHLWMWDEPSLTAELGQAGFKDIRPCAFNDSPDPRFRQVEQAERFDGAVALDAGN